MLARKRSGFLALLIPAALVVAVAAGAWAVYTATRLPHPDQANRRQLLRWLVTRDLAQEPFALRLSLVRRLEAELQSAGDLASARDELTAVRRDQLAANIPVLVEPWFLDKVNQYYALEPKDRTAYLDKVLEQLAALRWLKSLAHEEQNGALSVSAPSGGLVRLLGENFLEWQQRADPERRRQMHEFLAALQLRWLIRGIWSLSPA